MRTVENLSQFSDCLQEILSKYHDDYKILYRGQENGSYDIKSTLERNSFNEFSCAGYYWSLERYKPAINAAYSRRFERIIDRKKYDDFFAEYMLPSLEGFMPDMEYMTYLRHHGFPSPLTDWTASQYIALYFACQDFANMIAGDGAVWVYAEFLKSGGNDRTAMMHIGPYMETDKRHYAQQSRYLISMKYISDRRGWYFVPFMSYYSENPDAIPLEKIEIKRSAKRLIVQELREFNINKYTLFLDEDSFVHDMADDFFIDNHRVQ